MKTKDKKKQYYKYIYFVSFSHDTGFGCVKIRSLRKLDRFKDLVDIIALGEKKDSLTNVVILNFILLKRYYFKRIEATDDD